MPSIFPIKKPRLLIISFNFFVYAFSLFYSSNPNLGFRMLETKLSLFLVLFPFVFSLQYSNTKQNMLQKAFFFFVFKSHILSPARHVFFYLHKLSILIFIPQGFSRAEQTTPLIGEHHIYISLILAAHFIF